MITTRQSTTTPAIVLAEGGDTIRITSREEAIGLAGAILGMAQTIWPRFEAGDRIIAEAKAAAEQEDGA